MRQILIATSMLFACSHPQAVPCGASSDCDLTSGGACLSGPSEMWCAYPDASCPSGFRYSDLDVGDGVGGQCVGGGSADDAGNGSDADGGHTGPGLRVWGPPSGVANVNSTGDEYEPKISGDGLELYFFVALSSGPPYSEIYVATRSSTNSAFSGPMNVTTVNDSNGNENAVLLAHSGLELFITRGGSLMRSTRATAASAWSTPIASTLSMNGLAGLSANDLTLYYVKRCDAAHHNTDGPCLWKADRPAIGDAWSTPTVIEWPGGTAQWGYASVSNDGLRVLLSDPYNGTGVRAAQAERPDTSSEFLPPHVIDALSLETTNGQLSWNDSETEIYLHSNPIDTLVGKFDIYVSVAQ